jgi:hypothetical protein
MSEAQIHRLLASQRREQDTGYAGENVSDETEVLLIGAPC